MDASIKMEKNEDDARELVNRTSELEDRVKLLEDQFDDVRIDVEEQDNEGPRYYAALRGRFDPRTQDFVTGIFRSKEEYDGAVLGATKAKAKSKSACERAVAYYEENIEAVEVENSMFRNENGVHSPQWCIAYPVTPGSGEIFIVPTHDEANRYVSGSSTYRMKRYSAFTEASNRRAQEQRMNTD